MFIVWSCKQSRYGREVHDSIYIWDNFIIYRLFNATLNDGWNDGVDDGVGDKKNDPVGIGP